jgi:hypothetical protein
MDSNSSQPASTVVALRSAPQVQALISFLEQEA